MGNTYTQHVLDPITRQWVKLSGSGGSGAESYNELRDQPIRNATGSTIETFINLAGLDVGHYSLTGFYKIDSSHEVINSNGVLDVVVYCDDVTLKKVIIFPSVSNGDYYINKIIYDGFLAESVDKLPIGGGIDWGEFN